MLYTNFLKFVLKFITCNKGITVVEYGLIIALTSLIIVFSLNALGVEIGLFFDRLMTGFNL